MILSENEENLTETMDSISEHLKILRFAEKLDDRPVKPVYQLDYGQKEFDNQLEFYFKKIKQDVLKMKKTQKNLQKKSRKLKRKEIKAGKTIAKLIELGFSLLATSGTSKYLEKFGLNVEMVLKVHEGRPNIEDMIRSGQIQLVINTPIGRQAAHDDKYLRRAALDYSVPAVTTLAGARAAVEAIIALQAQKLSVAALQDIHS